MDTNAKIDTVAAILRELIRSMDPKDLSATKRYNMLKDLDRILDWDFRDELKEEMVLDE